MITFGRGQGVQRSTMPVFFGQSEKAHICYFKAERCILAVLKGSGGVAAVQDARYVQNALKGMKICEGVIAGY